MRNRSLRIGVLIAAFLLAAATMEPSLARGQATFTARLQGTVQDTSGGAIPGAGVTISNDATQVSVKTTTDSAGRYVFIDLTPAKYTITVESKGFKALVRPNVVLRVAQAADLDFTLEVGSVTTTVEVKGAAPLMNAATASLGQEVDNRYVTEMPLLGRDITNLAYLAPGITEVSPNGALFGSPATITGVNFVSNGQRLSTTEVRLDSSLTTSPEVGEGKMFTVKFRPLVESLQEFKVENNGLSAEYGNNGGTIINMVTKSGTNRFHGSGYWFGQRAALNAGDFFGNKYGVPKADFTIDQYGGSVGGPIKKDKTFFFFDYERGRNNTYSVDTATVPTDLERQGDFSQTFNSDGTLDVIYNPYAPLTPVKDASGNIVDYQRQRFANNVIPSSMISALALKAISFYPEPTSAGLPGTHLNNFSKAGTGYNPWYQFDIKIDQNFSEKSRLMARYSDNHSTSVAPLYYGNPADSGAHSLSHNQNAVLSYTRTLKGNTVWDTRVGVMRTLGTNHSTPFDVTSVGFPSILQAGGFNIFPRIDVTNFASLGTFGWTDTIGNGTQFQLASTLNKIVGPHSLKFGGERRWVFTNFTQPGFPGGYFQFDQTSTWQDVYTPNADQGNGLAGLLVDFGSVNSWGGLNIQPGTATLSKETAFFAEDDWRVTNKLTLNLGLRYEWSSPYTERFNHIQFLDERADTGVNIPGLGELHGIDRFATPGNRTSPTDWNNLGPRLGFAYRANTRTVIRGGAGIYYGVQYDTNSWLSGPVWRSYSVWHPTLDGGLTRFATLENPYPHGLNYPQGTKYGNLNMWGYGTDYSFTNNLNNADIYQWNIGIQRELSDTLLLEVNYSGNRSTHLPYRGTDNRDFLPLQVAQKYGHAALVTQVPNPFLPFFQGPSAVFNEPPSIYNQPTVAQSLLLMPYPQFAGSFAGLPLFVANSRYNALQVRFEKRFSHGLNFLGNYTYSRLFSDNDVGGNTWLGNYVGIQDLGNLKAESSVGGSNTPHRLVFSWSYELPVGRGRHFGSGMNRWLNGVLGGWQVNGFLTFQSGFPIGVSNPYGVYDVGTQRPNVTGNPRSQYSIKDVVDGKGNFFNQSAFSDPGPEKPGNEVRFDPRLRANGAHNLDASAFKKFRMGESKELQFRAEFFNFTNTPRFGFPDAGVGDQLFGTITNDTNGGRQVQMGARFVF